MASGLDSAHGMVQVLAEVGDLGPSGCVKSALRQMAALLHTLSHEYCSSCWQERTPGDLHHHRLGLRMARAEYAYNHEEAIVCLRKALEANAVVAMALKKTVENAPRVPQQPQ